MKLKDDFFLYLGLATLGLLLLQLVIIANSQEVEDTSTGFERDTSGALNFIHKGQRVFSVTNQEATSWLERTLSLHPIDTNLYGVLYNVSSNSPGLTVLERRGTDRLSGVRVFEGDGAERMTNRVLPPPPPVPVTDVAKVLFTWRTEPGYQLMLVQARAPIAVTNAPPASASSVTNTRSPYTLELYGDASPDWLLPRMAEVAIRWEPSRDAVQSYRVYALSSKTTNTWVSKPEWLVTPGYVGEPIIFTVVLDLSVPTWTKVVAVEDYSKAESPATEPVYHSALTPIRPPGQHKQMFVRALNQPIEHRSRMRPMPVFPPLPP